jgi:hypothetical protein
LISIEFPHVYKIIKSFESVYRGNTIYILCEIIYIYIYIYVYGLNCQGECDYILKQLGRAYSTRHMAWLFEDKRRRGEYCILILISSNFDPRIMPALAS